MRRVRPNDTERAIQIGTTVALDAAHAARKDPVAFMYWINAASSAIDRTRLSMMERDVTMFRREDRGGIGA